MGSHSSRSSTETSPSTWRRSKPTRAAWSSFVTRCEDWRRLRRSARLAGASSASCYAQRSAPVGPSRRATGLRMEITMEPKLEKEVRFLKIYAVIATLACAVFFFTAFAIQSKKQKFEEIDVERINIVEKDGKLRMVISNQERQHHGI